MRVSMWKRKFLVDLAVDLFAAMEDFREPVHRIAASLSCAHHACNRF